ncbi:MAG: hypothetical protein LBL46_02565 [Rickettsiales bacterium]|jgi:hypothetical protein|nr:hypothetical protein [Rickettsiales bacterium]
MIPFGLLANGPPTIKRGPATDPEGPADGIKNAAIAAGTGYFNRAFFMRGLRRENAPH